MLLVQELERHFAIEAQMPGAPHDPHSAAADFGEEFVAGNLFAKFPCCECLRRIARRGAPLLRRLFPVGGTRRDYGDRSLRLPCHERHGLIRGWPQHWLVADRTGNGRSEVWIVTDFPNMPV